MRKKKQYQCSICDYISSEKSGLKRHAKCVHENKEPAKLYHCSFCPVKFSARNALDIHIDSVHDKIKSHECLVCNANFATKVNLKKHGKKKRKKTLNCSFCAGKFLTKTTLNFILIQFMKS